jgi:hypothetical protein
MHRCTLRGMTVFGILAALFGVFLAAQDVDPILGIWVLNVAASKFSPGRAPQSESCTYVMEGQETKLTSRAVSEPRTYRTVRQQINATATGVDGNGKPTTREWTIVYDGKDRPTTGDPDADMLALKRIDPFTVAFTKKRAGRVVINGTWAISRDGKVLTITTQGVNTKGETINDVSVFEKR